MSAGYYLLVRFDDRSKLPLAVGVLESIDSIQRWDPVDGYYSLVIKTDDLSVSEKVSQLEGFSELARCEIKDDNEVGMSGDDNSSSSYLFIETENHQQDSIQEQIKQCEGVMFVSPTIGDFDLVAVLGADNFDQIDRVVRKELRLLDGVIRIKQDRIIHLDRI